ncbi:MAG: PH domain-containing protein [Candidatus Aenigmarchaeota archaeon]|nr:PH domain-containing protein [Candidatus Aenigmarchaeota archaeon]MDW8149291.1 PH domain-containing protein [Candidatus Aenigmarchaeota archaeon]
MLIERSRRAYLGNYVFSILLIILLIFTFGIEISFILLFLVTIYIFYSLYEAEIKRRTKKYKIEENEIIIKEGLINKKIEEIKFEDIGSFSIRKNFLGKLLNFGDLIIYTNTKVIVIEKVYKPEELLKIIKHKTSI